jgi:hypothetical protein
VKEPLMKNNESEINLLKKNWSKRPNNMEQNAILKMRNID